MTQQRLASKRGIIAGALFFSITALPLVAAAEGKGPSGQPPHGKAMGHHFQQMMQKLDSDGDGRISQQEFMSHQREKFSRMDHNGDGYIDDQERQAMRERMKNMKERRKAKTEGSTDPDQD